MRCAWARRVTYGYNPRIYGAGARCQGPSTCPTTVLCRAGSHMTAGRCDMAARSSDLGRAKTTTAIEKTNKLVHQTDAAPACTAPQSHCATLDRGSQSTCPPAAARAGTRRGPTPAAPSSAPPAVRRAPCSAASPASLASLLLTTQHGRDFA